jgi:uncharacterized repeat protein (TIGR04076 family)
MADKATLNFLKEMLGYTEAQWETWKSNPRNLKIVENLMEIPKYKVVFEVTSSVGCAAGHKVGDQIIFDGGGSLLCKESPEKICFGLLSPINPIAGMVLDKICIGEDPTQMAFNRVHCTDVGVDRGGWGEVVVGVKVEKTQE